MPRAEAAAPVCVELHDVAPATWEACRRLLDMVDAIGAIPVTLLVVPDYHRRGSFEHDLGFVRAVDARLRRSDEVALHGYCHLDEGPPARSPRAWVQRRLRTLSEGEFAALDGTSAAQRIGLGLAALRRVGWPVRGFVPPAWLLGAQARTALADTALAYVALRDAVHRLPAWDCSPSVTLAYAAFTRLRRLLSRPVLERLSRRAPPGRLLRFALHPVDARHPEVLGHWHALLVAALAQRPALTLGDAMARPSAG